MSTGAQIQPFPVSSRHLGQLLAALRHGTQHRTRQPRPIFSSTERTTNHCAIQASSLIVSHTLGLAHVTWSERKRPAVESFTWLVRDIAQLCCARLSSFWGPHAFPWLSVPAAHERYSAIPDTEMPLGETVYLYRDAEKRPQLGLW